MENIIIPVMINGKKRDMVVDNVGEDVYHYRLPVSFPKSYDDVTRGLELGLFVDLEKEYRLMHEQSWGTEDSSLGECQSLSCLFKVRDGSVLPEEEEVLLDFDLDRDYVELRPVFGVGGDFVKYQTYLLAAFSILDMTAKYVEKEQNTLANTIERLSRRNYFLKK